MEVSCSEVLSQFEMLSGLEKFSLDSGNGKNDENQEKNGIIENVFFSSRKHALQRLIEALRPKMPNVFFQLLFFQFDPTAQLFRYYSFKSKFDLPSKF